MQAIETKLVDTSRYRYIIFLNSSVRGPFLPPYWPVSSAQQSVRQGYSLALLNARGAASLLPLLLALLLPLLLALLLASPFVPLLSVRLPARLPLLCGLPQREVHWSKVLTQRLTDKVKLSGSTIRWVGITLELVDMTGGVG